MTGQSKRHGKTFVWGGLDVDSCKIEGGRRTGNGGRGNQITNRSSTVQVPAAYASQSQIEKDKKKKRVEYTVDVKGVTTQADER